MKIEAFSTLGEISHFAISGYFVIFGFNKKDSKIAKQIAKQILISDVVKLQLELNSEKDKTFGLEREKSCVEQTVLELQASSEILGQRKQQLEEELEQVRYRITQLEADLSALKNSKVEDVVVLDDAERMSERSDEIALLFKITLQENEINELRKLLPKAGERDQLEVDLKRATSKLKVMQRGKEDLWKQYSETLIELDSYKNLQQEREAEPKKALKRDMFGRYCGERKRQFTQIIDKNPSLDTSEDTSQRSKWGLRSSGIPGVYNSSTPVCSIEPLQSTKQTNEPKKNSQNRTQARKRRNAQTLPQGDSHQSKVSRCESSSAEQ